ncbi:MAG: replication initiator protein A [Bacteroidetes bacterium]|nr:replication initiator protein A [Bacteroidota bacterium]MCB0851590.1 replication initiator protein A [Bacteroidota bacterium]
MAKKKQENDPQQLTLFAPAFPTSIAVKDQQDLMQYPFFSLSKRKRLSPIEYDDGRVKIKVMALHDLGMASIFDADILVYAASQIREAVNKGNPDPGRRLRVSRYDILNFVGKATNGKSYKQLENALDRLYGTVFKTTIRREKNGDVFGKIKPIKWLDDYEIITKNNRPIALEIELPQWLYDGILNDERVLTIDRAYFELEGGLERFIYRLCRKVAGETRELQMKLETVHKRSGSPEKPGKFRKAVERVIENQSIPGYWVFIAIRASTGDEYVCAHPKKRFKTLGQAIENTSFIAMDRALIKSGQRGL